jgi:hypothetical protein
VENPPTTPEVANFQGFRRRASSQFLFNALEKRAKGEEPGEELPPGV